MSEQLVNRRQSLTYMGQGQWEQIQRTTFTNWVNEQLRHVSKTVKDIRTDFTDGVNLVTLVEALTGRPVSGALQKPANQYQKLQNITVALETVANDGVKIVNIDSQDVSEGNLKLILALVWLLVVRYQGGLGAAQHRKWMLAWIQAVIPECQIRNFTTDWNDGTALHALLEFCKQGIAPDWRSLDKEDKLNNCRRAMELAQEHFQIPLVLLPEDLSSPQLDEKSAILYLSYFTRVGGPGYNATREKIQEKVRSREISNFTTDWADGSALAELVTSCGGHVPGWPADGSDDTAPREVVHRALEAGRELGIEPLLTPEEIVAEGTEHMGMMAHTAQFMSKGTAEHSVASSTSLEIDTSSHDNSTLLNGYSNEKVTMHDDDEHSINANTSYASMGSPVGRSASDFQLVRKSSIKSLPEAKAPSDSPFRIDIYSVGVIMESKMTGRRFDPEQFKVEAEAPSGRVIRMCGDGHYSAQFTPDEIGRWRVAMYYNNEFMDGCPVDVCDPSQVLVRGLRGGHIGKQQTFQVDCTGAGQGDLGVDIAHKGRRLPAHVTETMTPRLFNVTYTPYDPGPFEVNVHFNRAEVRDSDFHSTDPEERRRQAMFKTKVMEDGGVIRISASCDWEIDYVTGGPFVVHVTDSSDIEVYGMKDGTVCNNPELIVNCTKAGEGTLTAEVTHRGARYPCKVRRDAQPGVHHVSFTPRGPGLYKIWMDYDGRPVKGSPFLQEIAELGKPRAYGDGLYRGIPGRPQTFSVDPRGHPGHFTAQVSGPSQDVPCHLTPQSDGTLLGSYVPKETGPHTMDIRMQGKPIEESPFKPFIVDPSHVRPAGGWSSLVSSNDVIPLHVNREKQLPFDTFEAGLGEMTAEVRGPSGRIPVAIDARNDGKHTVIFTPREEGMHYMDVKWGGFSLVNSPFKGYATWSPDPVIYPEKEVVSLKQIPLHRPPAPEEKDILPLTVGKEKQMTFDTAQAGPGQLTATVKGPHKYIPVAVDDRQVGQPSVLFTPQEEGKHLVDVSWNGSPMSASPFIGYAVREPSNNNHIMYPSAPPVCLHSPSVTNRTKDEDKDIIPLTVFKEKRIPFDASQAGPGRLTTTVRGPTHTVPPSVEDRGDGKPVVCFVPEEEGKHYIDVSWNGSPLAESPLLGYASRDLVTNGYTNGLPAVRFIGHSPRAWVPTDEGKEIIPLQVNKEKALPFDASSAGPGQMTASVRGPNKPIPAKVKDGKSGRPIVHFTPEEEGKHSIRVNWNGRPIAESPLVGYAAPAHHSPYNDCPPVYLAGYHPRGGQPYSPDKDIIPLKVNQSKRLPFDASEAGPGVLTATVLGPSHSIPVHVEDRKNGKPTVHFSPEEEGKHLIDVDWNGQPVPKSPFVGYASKDPVPFLVPNHLQGDPDVSFRSSPPSPTPFPPPSRAPGSPVKVVLSGRGLKEAEVKQPAVFHVDGTQAIPGKPTAHLESPHSHIPVYVEPIRPQVFRCYYVPETPGPHKLSIGWNERPLRGSPFPVNVKGPKQAPTWGTVYPHTTRPGEGVELKLVHPDPSQLSVRCRDPRGHVIPCNFHDNRDGTHSLKMTPTMPGRHVVDIRQDDHHVMGSPYYVDISDSHLSSGKVRVWGPGIQRGGVLRRFHSNFWVDATGAGAGELRVRIMGPKGAFHVTMSKAKQRDKLYQCFYDPLEAGLYTVHVQWSGLHVQGSPFTVCLANSPEELEAALSDLSAAAPHNASFVEGGSGDRETGFLY